MRRVRQTTDRVSFDLALDLLDSVLRHNSLALYTDDFVLTIHAHLLFWIMAQLDDELTQEMGRGVLSSWHFFLLLYPRHEFFALSNTLDLMLRSIFLLSFLSHFARERPWFSFSCWGGGGGGARGELWFA